MPKISTAFLFLSCLALTASSGAFADDIPQPQALVRYLQEKQAEFGERAAISATFPAAENIYGIAVYASGVPASGGFVSLSYEVRAGEAGLEILPETLQAEYEDSALIDGRALYEGVCQLASSLMVDPVTALTLIQVENVKLDDESYSGKEILFAWEREYYLIRESAGKTGVRKYPGLWKYVNELVRKPLDASYSLVWKLNPADDKLNISLESHPRESGDPQSDSRLRGNDNLRGDDNPLPLLLKPGCPVSLSYTIQIGQDGSVNVLTDTIQVADSI